MSRSETQLHHFIPIQVCRVLNQKLAYCVRSTGSPTALWTATCTAYCAN